MKNIVAILLLVFSLLTLPITYAGKSVNDLYSGTLMSIGSDHGELLTTPIKSDICPECTLTDVNRILLIKNVFGEHHSLKIFPEIYIRSDEIASYHWYVAKMTSMISSKDSYGSTMPLFIEQQAFLI